MKNFALVQTIGSGVLLIYTIVLWGLPVAPAIAVFDLVTEQFLTSPHSNSTPADLTTMSWKRDSLKARTYTNSRQHPQDTLSYHAASIRKPHRVPTTH